MNKINRYVRWLVHSIRQRPLVYLLLFVAVLAVALGIYFLPLPDVYEIREWVSGYGAWSPLVFVVAYIVLTQFPIPRSLWTISSGLLFAPHVACLLVLTATGISGLLTLWWARKLGRARVMDLINRSKDFSQQIHIIDSMIESRGSRALFGLRMVPIVPFSILNYIVAITSIKPLTFLVSTVLGSAPGSVVTIYTADALATAGNSSSLWLSLIFIVLGLAIVIREGFVYRRALTEN